MVWLNFSQNMYVPFVIFLMAGNMKLAPYFIYTWNVFVWLDKVYRDLSIIKKNQKTVKKTFNILIVCVVGLLSHQYLLLIPFFEPKG